MQNDLQALAIRFVPIFLVMTVINWSLGPSDCLSGDEASDPAVTNAGNLS